MLLYVFANPAATIAVRARLRLRFDVFFVRMWRLPGRFLFSLPVAVTLNFEATALFVFILGTVFLP